MIKITLLKVLKNYLLVKKDQNNTLNRGKNDLMVKNNQNNTFKSFKKSFIVKK